MPADTLEIAILSLEHELGIKPGFFLGLLSEDDWSFTIKLHALIEAAISHLLSKAIGDGKLENIFGRIELGDSRTGKLAFIRDLDLIEPKYRRVIRSLSEIRNQFVHDVRNVGAALEMYLSIMDKQQINNFVETFSLESDAEMEIQGITVGRKQFVSENPKIGIWMATMGLLGDIYIQKQKLELNAGYSELAKQLAKQLKPAP